MNKEIEKVNKKNDGWKSVVKKSEIVGIWIESLVFVVMNWNTQWEFGRVHPI